MTRLHPLTPLLKGIRAFWVIIAALSWQGFAQFGAGGGALIVAIGGLCVLGLSFITWLVTGFEVVGRELRIHEGLFVRRSRAVPLERLQAIEVVRPLLARLTGLAELRIEVIGGDKSKAHLAYLLVTEAEHLRIRLLELAGNREATPEQESEQILYRVPIRELALSQLLTVSALSSPFVLAIPIFLFVLQPDLTFVGIAGTITAALGTLGTPLRRFLHHYGFTVARTPDGLRIHRGATETRSQTVPPSRVQSVAVVRPLLWRPQDWVRCDLHVAGVKGHEAEAFTGDTLLPVASPGIAAVVLDQVLPGAAEATTIPLAPAPAAAQWRAPVWASTLGFGLTPTLFVTRSGLLNPTVVVVPYRRIQAVSLEQGLWQRALGLASVRVHTAGSARIMAPYRTVAEANWLAAELHARTNAARNYPGARSAPAG